MELVLASNNKHKLNEISNIISNVCVLKSLSDIGCSVDIPETQPTIEGNAIQKARFIYDRFKMNCLADDTGLEIETLDGAPGVISARFAGVGCSFSDNMRKVLMLMEGKTNREAAFRTIFCLIIDGKEYLFEGRVDGIILEQERGENGFGYDPIFQPVGYDKTFAEMSLELKNTFSHRARACMKLVEFLGSTNK